ncbi:MAG: TrmB family transcriptional regulator [Blastocatellia bacterium]|nr:TrmB family transcriptional regulator [Blastocatellia bacterium]
MSREDCLHILEDLGFSKLEAGIYLFLLEESPVTGYRVAQALGKPVANTYKAIESLANKGAVLLDEGDSRLCRAVPPEELLGRIERRFQEQKLKITEALAELRSPGSDDRVYQLKTAAQVFERCRLMLEGCHNVALLDVFPEPLATILPDLERLLERQVTVALKVYAPTDLPDAHVFLNPSYQTTRARWPGQWVNLVVDGRECLLAFLTEDGRGVHQAIWSGSPYLSWVYHSAVASELILDGLTRDIQRGIPVEILQKRLVEFQKLKVLAAEGYELLKERFQFAAKPAIRSLQPKFKEKTR